MKVLILTFVNRGGSPGLVVLGGDSRSEGCGFESHGNFSHIFVVKICNVCLKRWNINEKEARVGPFLTLFRWNFRQIGGGLLAAPLVIELNPEIGFEIK